MKAMIFLALLFLSAAAWAADYPVGMKLFGYYAAPPGAGFTVENFTYHNAAAYAIVSGGEVYALLQPNFPFIMPKPITGRNEIALALESYYLSRGNTPVSQSDLSPLHAGIKSVREIRRAGEAECRRLAGLATNSCSDFECYRTACIGGASSFCPNFAYGGTPGEFIGVIWQFDNNTRGLDAAYSAENFSYGKAAANPAPENIAAYVEALSRLNKAATAASGSALFLYSFCEKPDYSLSVITNMQSTAQKRMKAAQAYYALNETSYLVQNRTLAAETAQKKFALPPSLNLTDITSEGRNASDAKMQEYERDKAAFMQNGLLYPAAIVLAGMVALGAVLLSYAFWPKKKSR